MFLPISLFDCNQRGFILFSPPFTRNRREQPMVWRLVACAFVFSGSTLAQVSPHGSTDLACRSCHTAGSWKMRSDSAFDHASTGVVLSDRHRDISCATCHDSLRFSLRATRCSPCHVDVHKGERGGNCALCHIMQAWVGPEMMRGHEKGRLLLTGAHEAVPCRSCHVDGNFKLVFAGCSRCHEERFRQTLNPDHRAMEFSHDCTQCHSTEGWQPARFDHSATHFPLTGAHATAACRSCHPSGDYKVQFVNCYQCHQTQFEQSANPNHVLGSFPHECQQCHSATAWRPSIFTHDQQNFRIFSGRHRNVWSACSDCHRYPGNFAVFSCLGCHDEGIMDPRHLTVGGYAYASPACYSCHRDA